RRAIAQSAQRRKMRADIDLLNADPPATAGPQVVQAIQTSCQILSFACKPMVSRAYHDSLFMARVCPTSMIFIPCRGGVSHRPDEYASPEAIAGGVRVLATALAQLSGQ